LRNAQNLINSKDEARAFNQNLMNDEINSDGEIFLINEVLREPLMHIANKLLGRQRPNFEQLTPPEQELWSLFEKSDIFEFLTGQKDTVPQFENFLTFGATPKVNIDIQRIAQNLHPILPTQHQGAVQRALSAPTQVSHFLRERKEKIDYKAIHLGQEIKHDLQLAAQEAKGKCKAMRKSVRKSAKAAVTKMAPGAFSPKQQPPASAPSLPRTTSSLSWNFYPQNEWGLSSPGSGTETARCKCGDSCQTTTSFLPFRKIRGLNALHSRQGPIQLLKTSGNTGQHLPDLPRLH
jgi:hypothetical protein